MSAWDFEDSDDDRTTEAEGAAGEKPPRTEAEEAADKNAEQAGEQARPEASEAPEAEDDEPQMTMDDVDLDEVGPAELKPGDIISGVVVSVTEEGVLVDVGDKAEGIVPVYEFLDRSEIPSRDDTIEVAVVKLQDEEGMTILSKKRADYERVWNRVISALETGEVLDAMVTDRVKGGLRVDLGVSGFVPASHVATRDVRNLDRFVGRSLRLKVLEADRQRKKVVLSHRLVVEDERRQRRQETMDRLQEGLVCEGKVRNITDYGAFIDLGGVDGLLHVSEMSWGRVDHPSDVCSVGDTLRVVVLDIDRERDRISLGRRQILPDPWKEIGKHVRPGSMVTGRISRVVRTGAFVELLEYEVEGFLPIGEMAERRIDSPSEVIEEGQEVQLKVLKLRPQARRMTLSLVAAVQEQERQEMQQYMADEAAPKPTLGDQFGDVLGAVAAELGDVGEQGVAEARPAAEEAPAPEADAEAAPGDAGEQEEVEEQPDDGGAADAADEPGEDDAEVAEAESDTEEEEAERDDAADEPQDAGDEEEAEPDAEEQ